MSLLVLVPLLVKKGFIVVQKFSDLHPPMHLNPLVLKNVLNDSLTHVKWFSDNQMQANPDKCQGIAIGQKSKNENMTFNLGWDCIIN